LEGGAKEVVFELDAINSERQFGGQEAAGFVQEERILGGAGRKDAFSEAGQKDDVERAAASLPNRGDKDATGRGFGLGTQSVGEARAKDAEHGCEVERSDALHRFEFGEDCEDRLGLADGGAGEAVEPIEPGGPGFAVGMSGEEVEEREGEPFQVSEVLEVLIDERWVGQFAAAALEFSGEAVEAAWPAIETFQDPGIFNEPLPAARDGQFGSGGSERLRIRIGIEPFVIGRDFEDGGDIAGAAGLAEGEVFLKAEAGVVFVGAPE
jgi:hypothetical protein